MKVTFKIIAIAILIICTESAWARSVPWVIGASFSVKTDNDDNSLNSQLAASGLNATAKTNNAFRVVWQLYGGYNFSSRWGAELSYLDLGKVETTFTGTAVDIDTFLNSAQNIHPQTAQGWLVSMVHYIPIDSGSRVKARVGTYDWEADYTLQSGSAKKLVNQNGSDISFGVSLELGSWRRKNEVIGHIKWDSYSIDKKDISVIAVGFSYQFE